MLDDFFGRLLPFRLGVIEQGHLEHPQSATIPIHFMTRVVDGCLKADFSVDDSGPHVPWLFSNESMGQWSLRTGDSDPFPILIETVESYMGHIIGKPDFFHGSLIFDLASVNPKADMAYCSFTVSGLPRFYHPLTFSETGAFLRSEWDRDVREESRPPPHFQIGEYAFEYVLEDTTDHPSRYRVSFHRMDATRMKVEEAERVIEIWEGLFGFCIRRLPVRGSGHRAG